MATTVKLPKKEEINRARALAAAGIKSTDANVSVWLEADFLREMPAVTGRLAVALRLLRRLSTPRGLFPWWPNEGLNVAKYLNSKTPTWVMRAEIKAECLRDEEVEDVGVIPTIIKSSVGNLVNLEISVVTKDDRFDFIMTATEASANLIRIQNSKS